MHSLKNWKTKNREKAELGLLQIIGYSHDGSVRTDTGAQVAQWVKHWPTD